MGLAVAASLVVGAGGALAVREAFGSDRAGQHRPAAGGSAAAGTGAGLDRLLPATEAQLRSATALACRFVAAYGTYRFDEDPKTYLRRLTPMASPELAAELRRGAATPGILEQRRADHEVGTALATVSAARSVQKSSLVYVITAAQRLDTISGTRTQTMQYAVTLTYTGKSWLVSGVTPADLGQQGDMG
ncbi:MAG: hypothetical protein JWO67_3377 [Streptosporangiaceae bacterium]|nr:hypothetical protein [Streptosporangiaceae bacterium]